MRNIFLLIPLPVVILTVYGSREKIADTIELGADAYFIKDQHKMENIVASVRTMLDKK
ncbi:hypothetical protein ACFLZC_02385 [Patescibacteria group bacterium]